jgi:hypothetical protein
LDVPGLGKVALDRQFGWYRSGPVHVPILGRESGFIVDDGYVEDNRKAEYHTAISNFLGLAKSALREADEPLSLYYKDHEKYLVRQGEAPLYSAEDLWAHVTLGREPRVSRRPYGDRGIYVSVECECTWESEHGLELVFKNGVHVTKLGSYDGHLTNSDAYDDPRLENVIYHSMGNAAS